MFALKSAFRLWIELCTFSIFNTSGFLFCWTLSLLFPSNEFMRNFVLAHTYLMNSNLVFWHCFVGCVDWYTRFVQLNTTCCFSCAICVVLCISKSVHFFCVFFFIMERNPDNKYIYLSLTRSLNINNLQFLSLQVIEKL